MLLNLVWLLVGISAATAIHSQALTSDHLVVLLPQLSFALSVAILLVGIKAAGPVFFRDMVVPLELGVCHLLCQPLPGMAIMPLIFGIWFGLANRLLARPVSLPAFTGQVAVIVSAGLLFWRHLGTGPLWGVAGVAVYAALSHRGSSRRVLLCG